MLLRRRIKIFFNRKTILLLKRKLDKFLDFVSLNSITLLLDIKPSFASSSRSYVSKLYTCLHLIKLKLTEQEHHVIIVTQKEYDAYI